MGRTSRRRLQALTQHVKNSACAATEPAREVTRQQSTAPHPGRILTDAEKRSLYHNGYVIIRDVVKKDVVQRIHDEIENSPANANGRHPAYVQPPTEYRLSLPCLHWRLMFYTRSPASLLRRPSDISSLVFESDLRSILTDLNGHWNRLEDWMWQPAYTPAPAHPSQSLTSPAQYANGLHVDGRRAIGGPGAIYCDAAQTMSIKPFQVWALLSPHFFSPLRSPCRHISNGELNCPPQNFVFVSVSDLRPLGRGQTHVLPAAHIAMEEFFNWQQTTHGEVGSLGPGWNMEADPERGESPRLDAFSRCHSSSRHFRVLLQVSKQRGTEIFFKRRVGTRASRPWYGNTSQAAKTPRLLGPTAKGCQSQCH